MADAETIRMQRDLLRAFGGSHWAEQAYHTICRVHDGMPETASLSDRTKAVDEAYPFGQRKYHPYKQWLKVRRAYLARYGYRTTKAGDASLPFEGEAQ